MRFFKKIGDFTYEFNSLEEYFDAMSKYHIGEAIGRLILCAIVGAIIYFCLH